MVRRLRLDSGRALRGGVLWPQERRRLRRPHHGHRASAHHALRRGRARPSRRDPTSAAVQAVKGFVPSTPHRRTRRPSRDHRSCPLSTSRHQSSGGFDNESVATTALVATFYCWVRALRDRPTARDGEATADSYAFGVLCGLAYVYMVAAWGGGCACLLWPAG